MNDDDDVLAELFNENRELIREIEVLERTVECTLPQLEAENERLEKELATFRECESGCCVDARGKFCFVDNKKYVTEIEQLDLAVPARKVYHKEGE